MQLLDLELELVGRVTVLVAAWAEHLFEDLMHLRALGGGLYLSGYLLMGWNIWRSLRGAQPLRNFGEFAPEHEEHGLQLGLGRGFWNAPVAYSLALILLVLGWGVFGGIVGGLCLWGLFALALVVFWHKEMSGTRWSDWYARLLANALPFSALTTVAVLIGGAVQILPTVFLDKTRQTEGVVTEPYSPLQLYGRDLYVKEGCYNCHSQMVRTLVGDVLRYGPYSKIGESLWDHPFQWGSKRTGPDLARVGGKYPNIWHFHHMQNPRNVSQGSTMPAYDWMQRDPVDWSVLPARLAVQRRLGVPYPEKPDAEIIADARAEALAVAADLKTAGAQVDADREIVALIAYLQRLGKLDAHPPAQPTPAAVGANPGGARVP